MLLSLNIIENIALIQEVHQNISVNKAENLAKESLSKIGLEDISLLNITQCSSEELFYSMLVRAMMCENRTIIIESPYLISSDNIEFEKIERLNTDKDIIVLDIFENKHKYKGFL